MIEAFPHPHCAMERFVEKHGSLYVGSRRPRGFKRGPARMCFMNATHLMNEKGLTYVEGFCLNKTLPIPIHHAWNVTDEGRVVDLTLRNPEEFCYMGVPFDKETVLRVTLTNKIYGLLDTGRGVNYELMDEFQQNGSVV